MRSVAVNRRTAVASCNAAGKSWLSSRIACWFLHTHIPSIVITTAPTERQVKSIIWGEMASAAAEAEANGTPLFPNLRNTSWQIGPMHYAIGFNPPNSDPASLFQGLHSENVLVIVDEGAAINDLVWEGIFSVLRGDNTRLLVIGNPTNLEGQFYRFFEDDRVSTFHISAFDTPNLVANGIRSADDLPDGNIAESQEVVIPGLVTLQDVLDARVDWGVDSFEWQARIGGQFPRNLRDSLIMPSWVTRAAASEVLPNGPVEVGVDVARYGADETVFVARSGDCAFAIANYARGDTMKTTGRLVDFSRTVGADVIKIEDQGVGVGVYDRLREMQQAGQFPKACRIVAITPTERAADPRRYADRTTEYWAQLADLLKDGVVGGPVFKHRKVHNQLISRPYRYDSAGVMKLMPKDEMRRQKRKSPDYADAIVFAFADVAAGYRVRRMRNPW